MLALILSCLLGLLSFVSGLHRLRRAKAMQAARFT